ncbi:hypothetical protein NLI96_g4881 [Meripilus lineatus]|uniref:GH16 domain-containing protein n=1 Tax=Meripilus lineatus TaxID=2056292 RepID=A0AAD5V4E2_9APHY|nr:hypothetical protein NLI96_g4881 [Physisporinus lineatus]
MLSVLPFALLNLLVSSTSLVDMRSDFSRSSAIRWGAALSTLALAVGAHGAQINNLETGVNGSTFVWTIQDTFEGLTFYDDWDFFTGDDPTHGMVNYTDRQTAFSQSLVYVTADNKVIMKGDNKTWLPQGQYRNSVRISSKKQYNTGLFILDLDKAPWGCGIWPAWWTLGGGPWPYSGEIDIIEGVHDNEHNQVAWHTGPNCTLTPTANFTGTIVTSNGQPNLNCDGNINNNAGCGVTEWSRASYGLTFDAAGGGVFAMKWDDNGIAIWSFYRAAVPKDIVSGQPSPSLWGLPVAVLEPAGCDPIANFVNHSIIFDITFCGDWAGNSYATSGCPGSCSDRLMDPANFVNATWIINSLKVYKKQVLSGRITGSAPPLSTNSVLRWFPPLLLLIAFALL